MSDTIRWIVRTTVRTWLFFAIAFGFIAVPGVICFGVLSLTGLDTGTKLAISTGVGIAVMWVASNRLVKKSKGTTEAQQPPP